MRSFVPALAPLLLLPLGFASLVVFLFDAYPQQHFFAEGIACLSGGIMIALLTSAITFSFARRGYPLNWPLTGTLIGAFGGTVALLALQISCPDHESGHLLVFHGLAMLASIAGGYLASTAPRPEPPSPSQPSPPAARLLTTLPNAPAEVLRCATARPTDSANRSPSKPSLATVAAPTSTSFGFGWFTSISSSWLRPNTVHLTTFPCYSVWGGRPREWPEPLQLCLLAAASPTTSVWV
ncbi:MAG: DUF1109 family protein [Bryobacterales bacterium]|nr:DUF1109 family protein [Bryobacterales bacterium]